MENFKANHAVISLSGGLDSTCLLLDLLSKGYSVRSYSFDYGQKHVIELDKVKKNIALLQSKGLPVTHQIINLQDVFSDSASSLHQGGEDIPHGMYDQDNMKSTVVENRNIIFSAIIYGKALAWANKINDNVVITQGLHAGDHCFTKDTKILTPRGYKTIEELVVGDEVYSFNKDKFKTELDKIVDIIHKGKNSEIYNISTNTGNIRLTSEHKVYIEAEGHHLVMTPVKKLKVGDTMISLSSECDTQYTTSTIKSIDIDYNEEDVYDITVEKNHNFFAGTLGNILISNSIYPDCRPESQSMAKELYKISNWGSERVDFIAPFININKGEVLRAGLDAMRSMGFQDSEINKVLTNTHTCYDPNEKGESCGLCGSCTERIEAFEMNNMRDPADYSLSEDELNTKYLEARKRLG